MAIEPEDLAGDGPFSPPTPIRRVAAPKPRTGVTKRESRPARRARLEREAAERAAAGDDSDERPPAAPPGAPPAKPVTRRHGTTGAERARAANRSSHSKWMTGLLSMVGRNVERAGIEQTRVMREGSPLVPFGRALMFNAPIAGATFDDAIKGSWVDQKAQPLLRRGDKFQAFGNAVGFPMLILTMQMRPELWDVLEPMAFEMFEANIESMGPMITAKVRKDNATQATIDKAVKEGMLPEWEEQLPDGTTRVRTPTALELFRGLFAPVELDDEPPPPVPAPEPPAADE